MVVDRIGTLHACKASAVNDWDDTVVGLPSSGMPLLVAIDVPPDTPPEYAAAVTGSCNAALGEGTCVTGGDQPGLASPSSLGEPDAEVESLETSNVDTEREPTEPTPRPRWVAVVRWDDEGYRTLRIELRPGAEQPPAEARVVAFTPADPPRQRWASAGLVVAALVSRRETIPRPPPIEPPPETEEPIKPPPPKEPLTLPPADASPSHPWARIDLGSLAGPGLDSGPARLGGFLRVSVVPSAVPLALHAGTGIAARGGQPSVRWVNASAGATLRVGRWQAPLAAEVRGEGVRERVWFTADDPARDLTEIAKRWRFGGRFGGDVIVELSAPAALFFGADVSIMRPEVIISVSGDDIGNEPVVRWAGSMGLRVSF